MPEKMNHVGIDHSEAEELAKTLGERNEEGVQRWQALGAAAIDLAENDKAVEQAAAEKLEAEEAEATEKKIAELTEQEKKLQTELNKLNNESRGLEKKAHKNTLEKERLAGIKANIETTQGELDTVRADLEALTDRNGNPKYSEETVENLAEAAQETGETPDPAAEEEAENREKAQEAWETGLVTEALNIVKEVQEEAPEEKSLSEAEDMSEAETMAFRSAHPLEGKMAKMVWAIGKVNEISEQLQRGGASQEAIDNLAALGNKLSADLQETNEQFKRERESEIDAIVAEYGGRGNTTPEDMSNMVHEVIMSDMIMNDPEQLTNDKVLLAQAEAVAEELGDPSILRRVKSALRKKERANRSEFEETEALPEAERAGLGEKIMAAFEKRRSTLQKVKRKAMAGFAAMVTFLSLTGCAKSGKEPAGAESDVNIQNQYEDVVKGLDKTPDGFKPGGEHGTLNPEDIGDVTAETRYEAIPGAALGDYSPFLDFAHKARPFNFAPDQSEFYEDREGTLAAFYDICMKQPESLAANVTAFPSILKAAGLNGDEMPLQLDNMLSTSSNGAELQAKLLAALEKALNDPNTTVDFYQEYRTEGSYMMFVMDGKTVNPNSMRLQYAPTVKRNGEKQVRIGVPVYDKDGNIVSYEVGDYTMTCGFQRNVEDWGPGKPFVPWSPADPRNPTTPEKPTTPETPPEKITPKNAANIEETARWGLGGNNNITQTENLDNKSTADKTSVGDGKIEPEKITGNTTGVYEVTPSPVIPEDNGTKVVENAVSDSNLSEQEQAEVKKEVKETEKKTEAIENGAESRPTTEKEVDDYLKQIMDSLNNQ